MAKSDALSRFIKDLKSTTKAERSISETLKKIIDDYCVSGKFDAYIETHAADAAKYLATEGKQKRKGYFRASGAGSCLQQQCFKAVNEPETDVITRPANQIRALYNGTFVHVRYHMLFDALHELGLVKTIAYESLQYNEEHEVTGTIDRVIEVKFDGEWVRLVADFKSIKRHKYDALIAPDPIHADQQHVYDLLKWGAKRWVMIYEDKDTHELKIYDREYDDETLAKLSEQYASGQQWVNTYKNAQKGEELPKLPLDTMWCNFCVWQKRCGELNG